MAATYIAPAVEADPVASAALAVVAGGIGVNVKAAPYNAVGNGIADDTAAVQAAINAASAAGGGTVVFPPGRYLLLGILTVPSHLSFVTRGATLDFSQQAGWADGGAGNDNGLVQMVGATSGAALALTRDAKRPGLAKITGITRSGTTATGTVDRPHGLAIGDYVFLGPTAGSMSSAEKLLYTVGPVGVLTDPVRVDAVPSSTTFEYTVSASASASSATAHPLTSFGKVVVIADTSSLAEDDMVMLQSEAIRADGASETIRYGEVNFVERVVNATTVLLKRPAQDNYLMSDTASLQRIDPVTDVHWSGFTFLGKGANMTEASNGQKGLRFDYARSCSVSRCTFRDIDLVSLEMMTCHGMDIEANEFWHDQANVSGRVSGRHMVQYQISYANGTESVSIRDNVFHNARHSVVQSSTAARPGISRNITITGNKFFGGWLAAVSTHQGNENLIVQGNTFIGSNTGVNPRYGQNTIIADNIFYGCEAAVLVAKWWNGVEVRGNVIERCQTGVEAGGQINAASALGHLFVQGNRIRNCRIPIDIRATLVGTIAQAIKVHDNTIDGADTTALNIQIGLSTDANNYWSGSVIGNDIRNVNQLGTPSNAVRSINGRGVVWSGNRIESANMTRGVLADGSGAGSCVDQGNIVIGATSTEMDFSTGTGHRSDRRLSTAVGILSDVASPRYISGHIVVDTESLAAADNLSTITGTGVAAGTILTVSSASASRVVTVLSAAGNIRLVGGASMVLDSTRDTLSLRWAGTEWVETHRASL